ncbi:hypothetical protein ABPG77_006423 [Micractinium sp. CCAP 211/92]
MPLDVLLPRPAPPPAAAAALATESRVPQSPVSPSCKPAPPLKLPPSPQLLTIPQFYFPQLGPQPEAQRAMEDRLMALLAAQPAGLAVEDLKRMLQQILSLPSSLAYPLFHKLATKGEERVAPATLLQWASAHNLCGVPEARRAFDILRQQHALHVAPEDLRPLLAGVLLSHPGLEFLQEAPEFQERYAETVIHRIFYHNNRLGDGRIAWREFRRGDILASLREVDEQEDINKVLRHFSYEHFYVIYCKFWDLDTDHDFRISRDDLLRYGNHSLTYRIVDRIFGQAGRPFHRTTTNGGPPAPGTGTAPPGASNNNGGGSMSYEDFVYFILSEEDKTTDASLDYWFRCCDLDSDGRLTPDELLYFYEEQLHRMECLSQESVSFDDIMAQMQDMINPSDPRFFTLHDLKRARALSGTLFNVLFNLSKFMAYETRDPFVSRQEREDGLTDWDRFARTEYLRLAMEEDADNDAASDGAWSRLDAL